MTVRVVQIIDRLNVGGPTKYVTWLASCLTDQFKTCVVTGRIISGEEDMTWYAKNAGVDLLVIPELSREISYKDIIVLYKILVFLFRFKPHIIHTHKAKAGAVGRLAAYLYRMLSGHNCKIIHVYHGHIFHSYYGNIKTKLFITIEQFLARYCTDIIVTVSQQQRQEINEKYQIGHKCQYRVIPYGIDFSTSLSNLPSLNRILGVSKKIPIVGFVGRLCEIKNPALFIQAAKLLKLRKIECKFVLIGDGNLRKNLMLLVSKLDLNDTVTFMGFRNDVMNIYSDLSIISITSFNEGTPFTLIEAMNFKVPVVSTLVGGVVDIMGDPNEIIDLPNNVTAWSNGLTVQSQDVTAFADAIQYIIEHNETAKIMGCNARHFVETRYSQQRFVLDMKNLYRQLTSNQI